MPLMRVDAEAALTGDMAGGWARCLIGAGGIVFVDDFPPDERLGVLAWSQVEVVRSEPDDGAVVVWSTEGSEWEGVGVVLRPVVVEGLAGAGGSFEGLWAVVAEHWMKFRNQVALRELTMDGLR